MKIKILHAYKDVMNLYGEYANITLLKSHLRDQGVEVIVDEINTIKDVNSLSDYDFIYIGAGTEQRQKLALTDLMTRKDELIAHINSGAIVLFTGNACELLGKSIRDASGTEYEALGVGDFTTVETDTKRTLADCYGRMNGIDEAIVGFINRASITNNNIATTFDMNLLAGDSLSIQKEGFCYKNTYGTHLIGPLLVKNPSLLDFFVKKIVQRQDADFALKDIEYPHEINAYKFTSENLYRHLIKLKQ